MDLVDLQLVLVRAQVDLLVPALHLQHLRGDDLGAGTVAVLDGQDLVGVPLLQPPPEDLVDLGDSSTVPRVDGDTVPLINQMVTTWDGQRGQHHNRRALQYPLPVCYVV